MFSLKKVLHSNGTPAKHTIVHEDPIVPSDRVSELENENDALRRRLDALEHEMHSRSPTRLAKKPQLDSSPGAGAENGVCGTTLYERLNGLSLKGTRTVTPEKKIRKLTARKWDLMDENEMDAYENF